MARTGEPSAPSMASGSAMKRQRATPIAWRFVKYSITVMPAGKKTSCVVHSWRATGVRGEKVIVRIA